MRLIKLLLLYSIIFVFFLTACSDVDPEIKNGNRGIDPSMTSEPFPALTKTKIPTSTATTKATLTTPTVTKTALPTPTSTPYSLEAFSSSQLRTGIKPVSYIDDTCSYLENRWGEGKSEPGTIVVPFMFHSIAKSGRTITDYTTISTERFEYFMAKAKELGFSTITIDELIGFLTKNEKIPQRSLLLIQDDRSPGVTEMFMPFLEEYDWTLTLAWPTTDLTSEALWDRMERLAESGRLDIQSHGHDHIYIQDYTPLEEIEEEVYKPIEVIQAHFGTTPQAIIWPGGNFTDTSIKMAEDAGFKVGFSVYSNGPLMYNWIPLREEQRAVDAPLMVLPRYWSPDSVVALEHALAISSDSIAFSELVKEEELDYLATYCQSEGRK